MSETGCQHMNNGFRPTLCLLYFFKQYVVFKFYVDPSRGLKPRTSYIKLLIWINALLQSEERWLLWATPKIASSA